MNSHELKQVNETAEKAIATIDRLLVIVDQLKATRADLLDAAIQAMDLIDGYQDVKDGDYGIPVANDAMKAYSILKDAIEKAERK